MDKKLLNCLKDQKVSLLLDNPKPGSQEKESYVGKIRLITDDFILLDTEGNTRISSLIVRPSMILSVWVYKNG